MGLQIEVLKRKFMFDEQELPEPNPSFSTTEVRDFYSGQYPELNNASIIGPVIKDGKQLFTFKTIIGSKG